MRLGTYAFHRAFWEVQSQENVQEVAFVSPDIPAFACIDAGHAARFLQHGLLSRSLLFPCFEKIDALTADESDYLSQLLPNSRISTDTIERPAKKPKHTVLIVARWRHDAEDIQATQLFSTWAKNHDLRLIVRLHPASDSDFWIENFPDMEIVSQDLSIEAILRQFLPKFVISWYSTVLAESLLMGLIPVTFAGENTRGMHDLVYPLYHRTLHWPEDRSKLKKIAAGEIDYDSVLQDLSADLTKSR
jgi:hypothetical protein